MPRSIFRLLFAAALLTAGLSSSSFAAGPTVYGFWPYWGDPLSTVRFESLTHLAIFGPALTATGSVTRSHHWTNNAGTALAEAEPYGTRIHLVVSNFDPNDITALLSSSANRAAAVSEIQQLLNDYGGHGVVVDLEGVPESQRANFVAFIQELAPAVEDLYVMTPAIDHANAYDYAALASHSDGLFIQGYGYHHAHGDPGPVAPLYGGGIWPGESLDQSVNQYLATGAVAKKLVLGLPLYGYRWPTTDNSVPGTATGQGSARLYADAVMDGQMFGRHWDETSHTPYAFPDSTSQLWYDDVESLEDKIEYALGRGLQGFGFWALTYEDGDAELWAMVDAQAALPELVFADGFEPLPAID